MSETDLRYKVAIDIRAAYNEIEVGLADLVQDHRAEMIRLIERMKHRSPKEIEEQVYKKMTLDLCPNCQKAFIRNPIRFHPEQGIYDEDIDIDAFLRSLGFGRGGDAASNADG